jgi:hypothetical protein
VWGSTQTIGGTFEGQLGKGTYAGSLILGPPYYDTGGLCFGPVCEDVTGTVTFSAKKGEFTAEVRPGSVVALEEIASHSFRNFELDLEVVSGTRSYEHADERLILSYESSWAHYTDPDGQFVNTIEDVGTLTGNPNGKNH